MPLLAGRRSDLAAWRQWRVRVVLFCWIAQVLTVWALMVWVSAELTSPYQTVLCRILPYWTVLLLGSCFAVRPSRLMVVRAERSRWMA
jgi:hypothetical protein